MPPTGGPKPDFHSSDPRITDGFVGFPKEPVKSWTAGAPSNNGTLNVLVPAYYPVPTPRDSNPKNADAVCKWANADLDCPAGGCFGISFTLPSGFATRAGNDPRPNPRPPALCLAKAPPWDISLDSLKVPDDACPQDADKLPLDFCQ